MSEDRLIDIVKDVENKSNKDLFTALTELTDEFNKTKDLIVSLTKHLDNVENMYNIVNDEIGKRTK